MHDFGALSRSERFFLVQAAYGKAMLQAHGLERTLATLLICQATFSPAREKPLESEISRIKKLALGPLIERFSEIFSPDETLLEELDNLLILQE